MFPSVRGSLHKVPSRPVQRLATTHRKAPGRQPSRRCPALPREHHLGRWSRSSRRRETLCLSSRLANYHQTLAFGSRLPFRMALGEPCRTEPVKSHSQPATLLPEHLRIISCRSLVELSRDFIINERTTRKPRMDGVLRVRGRSNLARHPAWMECQWHGLAPR